MQATEIRLLGAEAPKTDEGTTYGAATAAAAADVRRKSRRVGLEAVRSDWVDILRALDEKLSRGS